MKYWEIEGYDGLESLFEDELPDDLSKKGIIVILQRLACKHLDENEIVSSSLHRNTLGYTPYLEPQTIGW